MLRLKLSGGFIYILFSPLLGEMIQFEEHIFANGWFNHHLEKLFFICFSPSDESFVVFEFLLRIGVFVFLGNVLVEFFTPSKTNMSHVP